MARASVLLPSRGLNIPVGTVATFPGGVLPGSWLLCDGAAVSRTTYSRLFNVVGTTYGVGDGSTTFNLPDARGSFLRGLDNGRGVDSGRSLGSTQASQLGEHSHDAGTLATTSQNIGPHTHPITVNAANAPHNHTVPYMGAPTLGNPAEGGATWFGSSPRTVNQSNSTANAHTHPGTATADNAPHSHTISGSTASTGTALPPNAVPSLSQSDVRPRNIAMLIAIKA